MAKTFALGRVVATRRVWELIEADDLFAKFVSDCMSRYIANDWGVLDEEDWELNDESVDGDGRLLASYPLPDIFDVDFDDRLWIITEWDRSVTTILFPGDY